ncbi:hypothetical protein [Cellulomonas chengniuliangii]|uniref:Core-binding (CB) domain-containing protein n=1 Tax=Cellulomonas chengniuliangii TaxID=2968084 RepID=A0ABY5L1U5_9CELL|nr:hypothetical protein [Cellulomonas chengniuliangii]MCC2308389.1 hypothetical protein [Cellulomonas chengniuliangii]MCC2317406.1 hypothetical protein [Cellulomonas chengniuliangii]UUI76767.1 hypothetical protein NP064_07810 [Cellulomonas chengniuliangii]
MTISADATTPLGEVVQMYLDRLDAAPSTVRQRRWALRDLQVFADDRAGTWGSTVAHALDAGTLSDWLASRADSTVSAQRARASAARALAAFLRDHLGATDLAEAKGSLALPAAPPAERSATRGRALLAATAAGRPRPVLPEVWARFVAHVGLLAATGAGEDALARLRVADAVGSSVLGRPVPDGARHAVQAWLEVRSEVVRGLQGSDPGSLWVRVHAGADRRTGHVAPAGLAISARGLRLSFTTVRDALAAVGHRVGDVQVRDVRAVAERP